MSTKKPIPPPWAERATKRMKELDLTQEDLTEVLDVETRGAVGHYFRGRRKLSAQQAGYLAGKLNMSITEFWEGSEISSISLKLRGLDVDTFRELAEAESISIPSKVLLHDPGVVLRIIEIAVELNNSGVLTESETKKILNAVMSLTMAHRGIHFNPIP